MDPVRNRGHLTQYIMKKSIINRRFNLVTETV